MKKKTAKFVDYNGRDTFKLYRVHYDFNKTDSCTVTTEARTKTAALNVARCLFRAAGFDANKLRLDHVKMV